MNFGETFATQNVTQSGHIHEFSMMAFYLNTLPLGCIQLGTKMS